MITLSDVVAKLEKEFGCNCDLDNWQPEPDTGHSWVCRIHKFAKERIRAPKADLEAWFTTANNASAALKRPHVA